MKSIGSYIDRESVVHGLHPITKNFLFTSIFAVCLLTNNPIILAGIFILVMLIGKTAKLPIGPSLRLLKSAAVIIVAFSLLIWPFTLAEGEVLIRLGSLNIYSVGLLYGISMSLRFCSIVLMSIYWMMFTSIGEITMGLVKVGLPYKVAFSFSMSLRFVPLILNDLNTIKDAQRSRALEMDKGSLISKIKKNVVILIPLTSRALGMINQISISLEARGFGTLKKRTYTNDRRMSAKDKLIVPLMLLLIAVFIALRTMQIGLITTTVL